MHNCHVHADCTNTVGSFECSCQSNYYGNGRDCYPKCPTCAPSHAYCTINSTGFTTCQCYVGYDGDPFTECNDVDECSNGTPCGSDVCINTQARDKKNRIK